jgi:CheY-like chemotaxis protein
MSRVLLVEDDLQLLRAMQVTLHARGHHILTATTGHKALATAASEHPDLVVLDLGLPDLDGVEVIRGLRSWTPMPIIVLSGRTSGGDKVAALDAGADDYVTKPFGVEELLAPSAPSPAAPPHPPAPRSTSATTASTSPPDGSTPEPPTSPHHPRSGSPPPSGDSSKPWSADPADSSAAANYSPKSGDRPTPTTPPHSGSTSTASGTSSNPTPPAPAICSPNPAWATGTNPDGGQGPVRSRQAVRRKGAAGSVPHPQPQCQCRGDRKLNRETDPLAREQTMAYLRGVDAVSSRRPW